jgi:DNA-binding transcriptional LysR family regulator
MIKLEGIEAFVVIAEAGSISEAARRLGLSKSVVSERLAELERSLGARLVQRTTRKMSLTEDGLAFVERGRCILRDTLDATAEIAERRGALVGPLRISGPVSFGSLHLGPAIYSFLGQHPGIELTLDVDDRFVDIASDGYDAVIRHGPIGESQLIVKKLVSSRRVLVASPAYLAAHGTPRSLTELEGHRAILYTNRANDWRFMGPKGWKAVRPRVALRVNNGLIMRDAALAGLGVTLLATFVIGSELRSGALKVVDVGLEAEGAEICIAYPPQRVVSAKIRALTEWLRGAFGNPPYWEIGLQLRNQNVPHSR